MNHDERPTLTLVEGGGQGPTTPGPVLLMLVNLQPDTPADAA